MSGLGHWVRKRARHAKHEAEHVAHDVAHETTHAAHDVADVATGAARDVAHAEHKAEHVLEQFPGTIADLESAFRKLLKHDLLDVIEEVESEVAGEFADAAFDAGIRISGLAAPDAIDIQVSALTLTFSGLHADAVQRALRAGKAHAKHGDWEAALHDICDIADPQDLAVAANVQIFSSDLGAGVTLHFNRPGHRVGEIVDAIKAMVREIS